MNALSWLPTHGALPLTFCLFTILVASTLRGLTGFGFAIAAVPLFCITISPRTAVTLAVFLQLLSGLLSLRPSLRECDLGSIRWLSIGAVAGTPLGMLLLTRLSAATDAVVLSGVAMLALAIVWSAQRRAAAWIPMPPIAVGLGSGILNGLAAMPGPPVVAFFLGTGHDPAVARASMFVYFLITAVLGAMSAWLLGLLTWPVIGLSLLGLPLLILGNRIGTLLFTRGSQRVFRIVSLILMGVAALSSVAKAVSALGAGH